MAQTPPSRTPVVPGYVLVDRLRRGPQADVWRGSRESDGRPVALKIPAPGGDGGRTESALQRAARHDNLLAALDVVELDDGRCVLVTDLADGGNLADLVAARGRLTAGEAAAILAPVAGAVWSLHRSGIVHTDLSPSNIVFTATARPLLADLGSAASARLLTGVHGTEGFVAPEVLAGEEPREPADVFALGALAVHALTGQGVSPLEQVDRVVRRCQDAGELPEELEALLRAVLAPAAANRPRALDVERALGEIAVPEAVDIGGSRETDLVTYRVRGARPVRAVAPGTPASLVGRGRALLDRGLPGRGGARPAGSGRHLVPWLAGGAAVVASCVLLAGGAGGALLDAAGLSVQDQSLPSAAPAPRGAPGTPAGTHAPTSSAASTPAAAPTSTSAGPTKTPLAPLTHLTTAPTAAPASSAPAAASGAVASTTVRAGDPSRAGELATRPEAVTDAPAQLLAELLQARASALEARDSARLARVDAPGSWAHERDSAILAALRTRDETQSGLRFTVGEARVFSTGSGAAVLDASVSLDPYTYTRRGVSRPAPGSPPQQARYELTWVGGRWRVARVTPA